MSGGLLITVSLCLLGSSFAHKHHSHSNDHSDHHSQLVAVDDHSFATWSLVFLTLTATASVSFISVLGMIAVRMLGNIVLRVQSLIAAFGAGSILGSSVFVFMPEFIHHVSSLHQFGIVILAGITSAMAIEVLIHSCFEHSHDHTDGNIKVATTSSSTTVVEDAGVGVEDASSSNDSAADRERSLDSLAWNCLFGDALHNLVDGTLIGASMAAQSPAYAFYVAFMIVLHELPQEISELCILLHAGWPMKKALVRNALSTTTIMLGGQIGLHFVGSGTVISAENYMIGFVAGQFLYISMGQMIPSLARMSVGRSRIRLVISFMCGIASAYLIATATSHAHSHRH